ncbi:MAG: acyl-CoA dehydrogenase family protein [Ignavibacteriaceae bacterium]|jgi:glutaryl-CoA dehydrogenase|nr:MAG: acyl-CoA dehydrogenase [Chlorobiota bacterium]KXK01843.1 MAG: glutaryl-CoA dehydrogenase [Chlorobi bacterium OLB4]MBV6399355.1 Acyl-CoA dehydrogenase [Ignavibacteria bacterium]MCC6886800.1 acyl-CoA dehydrogenase family protein [Ignavibacteriales bacterium]MCE7953737.1 acyl-CoA dehydrogenase [Chlorobi bacterium CHB7]MDL1887671.1 acyl-CoA dehydrogenase [Ignavibacteria bacterium CHB1]MEB2329892.1 acyl-CoA dehydrogenase family protein [Ignavibacteriaceae bacterium]OQY77495.1 MAG: acyl-Co
MQALSSIKATDYYNLEDLYTEEEKSIRDTVREFVKEEVFPIIEKFNQEMKFPTELIPKMAELGVFGPTLPEQYGGMGISNIAYGLIMQELERGDSGVRSFASVQSALVMYPIYTFGSEEQRMKYLPKLATGELIGCFGLTEPDFGSNPGGMITKAEKVDSGYILNGAKMWITNGTIADVAVVWAKLDGKVRGFLVEKGTKGFSAPEMKGKLSLRASVTSELVFEDCLIPEENLLPNSTGLKSPLMCLTQARFGIAWGTTGLAMACYEAALNYSLSRVQFGKPIASFQITQEKLAYMLTEITKAQLLNYRLAQLKDAGIMRPQQVSLAKRNNCEIAKIIASMAREMLGANGILDEYPVMRHQNNIESVKTYEGTHEMHTLILGEDITGISAFE